MELASANLVKRGSSYDVNYGDDTQVIAEFYNEAVQNNAKSLEAGRPVFEDVVYVHIMFPGDRTKERRTKATDQHKQRFARQWEAFQKQESQAPTGTPIDQWPPLSVATAKNLKAANILTVEILAGASDMALSGIMGGMTLRDKAKAWLAQASDGAAVGKLVEENKNLKADIEALKAQIAEIGKASVKK